MARKTDDIDSIIESVNRWEARRSRNSGVISRQSQESQQQGKILVGKVDKFFSKLNVAAVKLALPISVGDVIEIGTEEEAIRQRITSMQINRVEVNEAKEGDDVGIALKYNVAEGSDVYKIVR